MPGFGTTRRGSIGALRHRVVIQQKTITDTDDRGQPVFTWTNVSNSWPCEIKTLTGGESEQARQLVADATHRVRMRARNDLNEQMRLVFRDRNLYIGYIDDVDQVGRYAFVICAEKK